MNKEQEEAIKDAIKSLEENVKYHEQEVRVARIQIDALEEALKS